MKESTSPSESTATSPSESTAQAQATQTELALEDNELTDEALAGVSGGQGGVWVGRQGGVFTETGGDDAGWEDMIADATTDARRQSAPGGHGGTIGARPHRPQRPPAKRRPQLRPNNI